MKKTKLAELVTLKKTKITGSVTMILMVLMVWGAVSILANPGSTYAFVTEGADLGLRVEASKDLVDVGNLGPGDNRESYLTAYNDGENPFTYYFDMIETDRKSGTYRDGTGKDIAEILVFTVERYGDELFSGTLKEFKELNMGRLDPGDSEQINVSVYFPADADNAYQGSSVTVRFAFRAERESDEGGGGGDEGGGGGGDTQDRPEPPDEEIEFEPQEEPTAPPAEEPGEGEAEPQDEELLVPQEDTPAAPGLPRTGQLPPWLWYGAGLALILAGVVLRRGHRAN